MSIEMSKNNCTDSLESVLCMIAGWKKKKVNLRELGELDSSGDGHILRDVSWKYSVQQSLKGYTKITVKDTMNNVTK